MNFLPETWILGSTFLTYLKQISNLFRAKSSNAFVKVQFKVRLQISDTKTLSSVSSVTTKKNGTPISFFIFFSLKIKKKLYSTVGSGCMQWVRNMKRVNISSGKAPYLLVPAHRPSSGQLVAKRGWEPPQGSLAPITSKQTQPPEQQLAIDFIEDKKPKRKNRAQQAW